MDEKLHELVIGDTNGQKEDREPDAQNPGLGKKNYRDLQMKLPDAVTNKLFDTNKIADQILEGSGAYDVVAGRAVE